MKFYNHVIPVLAVQMQFVKSLMVPEHAHVFLNTTVIRIVVVVQNV